MGAAVGVELAKPIDASDITNNGTLELARSEVVHLRAALGHFAKGAGFADVVYDASDLVLDGDGQEEENFRRCVDEVKHIRSALRLGTAGNKRKERASRNPVPTLFSFAPEIEGEDYGSSSSDSSSDDEPEEECENVELFREPLASDEAAVATIVKLADGKQSNDQTTADLAEAELAASASA